MNQKEKKGEKRMKKISIIVPVYYNQDNLLPLYADLKEKVFDKLKENTNTEYELIMVDDGSKDNSYKVMQDLAKIDSNIKIIHLSRNYGEHAAILAGLSQCTGDCAVRKAADLQEPSEMILDMMKKYDEGYKVVLATRADREEPIVQKAFSNLYAFLMRKLALHNMPKGGFDSFLIDRQVIDFLVKMQESNTSLMSQILWAGFETATVPYVRKKREIGKSRWTLSKKIKLLYDSLISFSYFPIKMITNVGFFSFFISVMLLLIIIYKKFVGKIDVEGYTSLIMVMLMAFGIIMLSIGILGEYLWRTYDAARKRPPYIIEKVEKGEKSNNG